jgi:hypothetical protein
MNRRGFLGSILALGAAPAIVKAEILMPVRKIVVVDYASEFEAQLRAKMRELKRDMEEALLNKRREELGDLIWDVSPMQNAFRNKSFPEYFGISPKIKHEWIITDLVAR